MFLSKALAHNDGCPSVLAEIAVANGSSAHCRTSPSPGSQEAALQKLSLHSWSMTDLAEALVDSQLGLQDLGFGEAFGNCQFPSPGG